MIGQLIREAQDVWVTDAQRPDVDGQLATVTAHDRIRDSCHRTACDSSRGLGSRPSRSACSPTSRPAYAEYVNTVGSAGQQLGQIAGVIVGRLLDDRPPLGKSVAYASGQLSRRLSREGEPQHLVRRHHPVGNQPDDPRGHGLGLARPGPGDDDARRERRLDHRRLLIG